MQLAPNRLGMKIVPILFSVLAAAILNAASDRPNIVWIVSEDNSKHWLRLYQDGGAPMPNIEELADGGLVFQNAFSNAPVCSVARSTLITGAYARRELRPSTIGGRRWLPCRMDCECSPIICGKQATTRLTIARPITI